MKKVKAYLESIDKVLGIKRRYSKKFLQEFSKIESKPIGGYYMGKANPFYGKKHSKATKQYLSQKQLGVPIHTEAWKKELSRRFKLNNPGGKGKDNPFYGKTHNKETRKYLSAFASLQNFCQKAERERQIC